MLSSYVTMLETKPSKQGTSHLRKEIFLNFMPQNYWILTTSKLPSLIGSLQWAVSLGHRNIATAVIKCPSLESNHAKATWIDSSVFLGRFPKWNIFLVPHSSSRLLRDGIHPCMVKSLNIYLMFVHYLWGGKSSILHLLMHMCILTLSLVEL